jgi:hypothetical protein
VYELLDREIQMKAHIIHYTPLIERKRFIEMQVERFNITPVWILNFDKENLTNGELSQFTNEMNEKKSEISVFLKQVDSWRKIANSEDSFGLILEDDSILSNDFDKEYKKYIQQTPLNFSMVFIGSCSGTFPFPIDLLEENKNCAGAYIVSRQCAIDMINYFDCLGQKIGLPVDLWLCEVARKLDLDVYWAEPTIVQQGSETGKFKSSIADERNYP